MKKILNIVPSKCIIQFFLCLCIIYLFFTNNPAFLVKAENLPEVNSFSAVLIDADSGMIIYEKNKDEVFYPASITKIMTALLTLEFNTDYERRVRFSHRAVFSLPYGTSHIAMDEDETLSVDEAMYGLMLASANEVANALAEDRAGSIEDFATLMTERAKELGAKNTSFANPHGLHDENHYTTAYDMSLIMREAIKHPEFLKYISTVSYEIPPTEKQPLPRPLNNTNKMIIKSSDFFNVDVVGGKTGYTDEARHTLVTYASRGGINLIVAILHGEKNEPYKDTQRLLDYGFDAYEEMTLVNGSAYKKTVEVFDSSWTSIGTAELNLRENISGLFPKSILSGFYTEIEMTEELTEKSTVGTNVGKLKLVYDGMTLGETELYISKIDFVKTAKSKSTAKPTIGKEASEQAGQINRESKDSTKADGSMAVVPAIIFFSVVIILVVLLIFRYMRFKRYRRYSKPLRYAGSGRFNRYGRFK